jgi:hypothetical protein
MTKLVIFTSGTLGDHLPYLALAQSAAPGKRASEGAAADAGVFYPPDT